MNTTVGLDGQTADCKPNEIVVYLICSTDGRVLMKDGKFGTQLQYAQATTDKERAEEVLESINKTKPNAFVKPVLLTNPNQ